MSETTALGIKSERVGWLDAAKAIGIFLVFYGHYVEKMIDLGVPAATAQMNWIYSFHMPMFFFLAGAVYKRRDLAAGDFLKRQIRTRLLPAWIFNALGFLIWIGIELAKGPEGMAATAGWRLVLEEGRDKLIRVFVQGRPGFNILTWFLICLFMVELWQFALKDRLRSVRHLAFSAATFGVLAVLASTFEEVLGEQVGERRLWWELTPALMAMLFYQLGILCRQTGLFEARISNLARAAVCLACLGISLAVFNLNQGFENVPPPKVPLMIDGRYGEVGWFLLSSLAGTGFIVYLSQLLASNRFLTRLGAMTLGLMLLDGYWHLFFNTPLAAWIHQHFPRRDAVYLTLHCLAATVASMALCWPITLLMERYTPFLLGRSAARPATVTQQSAGTTRS